jgi:hypothetical protein
VAVNVVETGVLPSVAVSVMVEAPVCPVPEVIVAIQFGRVPERVMFPFGITVVFDEEALMLLSKR